MFADILTFVIGFLLLGCTVLWVRYIYNKEFKEENFCLVFKTSIHGKASDLRGNYEHGVWGNQQKDAVKIAKQKRMNVSLFAIRHIRAKKDSPELSKAQGDIPEFKHEKFLTSKGCEVFQELAETQIIKTSEREEG